MSQPPEFESLSGYKRLPEDEMRQRAIRFHRRVRRRRTVREFSRRDVPREVIERDRTERRQPSAVALRRRQRSRR
jgi:hypothetical protein